MATLKEQLDAANADIAALHEQKEMQMQQYEATIAQLTDQRDTLLAANEQLLNQVHALRMRD